MHSDMLCQLYQICFIRYAVSDMLCQRHDASACFQSGLSTSLSQCPTWLTLTCPADPALPFPAQPWTTLPESALFPLARSYLTSSSSPSSCPAFGALPSLLLPSCDPSTLPSPWPLCPLSASPCFDLTHCSPQPHTFVLPYLKAVPWQ